ncbi:MAG: hypothetical protein ACREBU_02160 [Nitrososphaera sp.]
MSNSETNSGLHTILAMFLKTLGLKPEDLINTMGQINNGITMLVASQQAILDKLTYLEFLNSQISRDVAMIRGIILHEAPSMPQMHIELDRILHSGDVDQLNTFVRTIRPDA